MRPSGPSCVDAGVEPCRRLHVLVAQELPNQFVRPGIRVENDLRCYVPELVACQLEADMSEYAPLDCYRDSPESSRPALAGYEQSIWAPADHRRCDLITKRIEPVGKPGRELKLERALILRLLHPNDKKRRLAAPLRPMKVLVELQRGEIFYTRCRMQENVYGERGLQIDEPPLRQGGISARVAP